MYRPAITLSCLLFLTTGFARASDDVDHVLVLKGERQLLLMQGETVLARFPVALGGAPEGPKRQEGDERTPEGRYVLDWRKPNSSYFRALHVSYPDEADVARAAAAGVPPGGAIMVHGTPNWAFGLGSLLQYFDWTNGCIALSNDDMQVVWDRVKDGTPIEIRP